MNLDDWDDKELTYSGKRNKELILKGKEVYDNLMEISKKSIET